MILKISAVGPTVSGSGGYRKASKKMKGFKNSLTEEQIWHVMAFENMFSNGGKPHDHSCYKP